MRRRSTGKASGLFCWLPTRQKHRRPMATGKRNLPEKGPLILIANQEEILDANMLQELVGREVHLLVGPKPSSKWKRLLGVDHCGAVKFEYGALDGWRQALDYLARGEAVVVSPLGWDGQSDLAGAAGLLSRRSGAPIIPIFLLVDCCHLPTPAAADLPPPDEILTFGPPFVAEKYDDRSGLTAALHNWFLTIDTTAHNRWPSPTATSWT